MDNNLEGSIGGQRILGGRLEVMGDSGLAPCLQLLAWGRLIGRVVFSFQAEDEALLSEEDDPIDRRPWTQQHLEAADIRRTPSLALTPPQAEQEVDVLDVNVRGPGQHLQASPFPLRMPALASTLSLCLSHLVICSLLTSQIGNQPEEMNV